MFKMGKMELLWFVLQKFDISFFKKWKRQKKKEWHILLFFQSFKYPADHPYTNTTLLNDIVLLELTAPFVFDTTVQPACLPKNTTYLNISDSIGYVSGWGKTADSKNEFLKTWAAQTHDTKSNVTWDFGWLPFPCGTFATPTGPLKL